MNLLDYNKANPPPVGTPDAKGTPFDPGKHSPRVHPKTQCWMPRSPGRFHAGQKRLPGVDAAVHPAPAAAPAEAQPAPAAPAADASPPSAETPTPAAPAPAAAPSFADIEAAAGPATPPTEAAAAPIASKAAPEDIAAADAQGALAAEILETVTGLFTGEPEEARMSPGDRSNMARVFARWFLQNNWIAVGGFLVAMMVATYFLKTAAKAKTREKIRLLWRRFREKKTPEKRAEPVTVEVAAAPAPVTVHAVAPAAVVPAAPVPFFGVSDSN